MCEKRCKKVCYNCIELDCEHELLYCAMCLSNEIINDKIQLSDETEQQKETTTNVGENENMKLKNELSKNTFWKQKMKIRSLCLKCPIDDESVFVHSNNKITKTINQMNIICPFSNKFAKKHLLKYYNSTIHTQQTKKCKL